MGKKKKIFSPRTFKFLVYQKKLLKSKTPPHFFPTNFFPPSYIFLRKGGLGPKKKNFFTFSFLPKIFFFYKKKLGLPKPGKKKFKAQYNKGGKKKIFSPLLNPKRKGGLLGYKPFLPFLKQFV